MITDPTIARPLLPLFRKRPSLAAPNPWEPLSLLARYLVSFSHRRLLSPPARQVGGLTGGGSSLGKCAPPSCRIASGVTVLRCGTPARPILPSPSRAPRWSALTPISAAGNQTGRGGGNSFSRSLPWSPLRLTSMSRTRPANESRGGKRRKEQASGASGCAWLARHST